MPRTVEDVIRLWPFLLALMVQTAGGSWWASDIQHRVGQLEKDQPSLLDLSNRVTRIEVGFDLVRVQLTRIEDKIDGGSLRRGEMR
jgi:hypothetical protein